MSDFLVIRNMKSPKADVYISGDELEENIDYTLIVDVSLAEIRQKKGTGEEGDRTFILMPTGSIRLMRLNDNPSRNVYPEDGETPGLQD